MAKQWNTPPAMQIDPKKKYKAHMETDKGTMVIELFADKAPKTVNNFVFLAREGYYDGIMFHRVISNFMAQGGDPTGRADLSRHMYGDASDIYIDNDGNGVMDDLNHDGKVDINDSRVILEAEERVERAYPELVGGGGLYRAAAGHGPFIHIDTRGYRARW